MHCSHPVFPAESFPRTQTVYTPAELNEMVAVTFTVWLLKVPLMET